jgi:hypothetical protein
MRREELANRTGGGDGEAGSPATPVLPVLFYRARECQGGDAGERNCVIVPVAE